MRYLKKFNWFKKKVEGPLDNFDSLWKDYKVPNSIIILKIQPNYHCLFYGGLKTINSILDKIEELSKKWNIVYNQAELYSRGNEDRIKFRISDSIGDSIYGTPVESIPTDIKIELKNDIFKKFNYHIPPVIEEFHERSYLLVDFVFASL